MALQAKDAEAFHEWESANPKKAAQLEKVAASALRKKRNNVQIPGYVAGVQRRALDDYRRFRAELGAAFVLDKVDRTAHVRQWSRRAASARGRGELADSLPWSKRSSQP